MPKEMKISLVNDYNDYLIKKYWKIWGTILKKALPDAVKVELFDRNFKIKF